MSRLAARVSLAVFALAWATSALAAAGVQYRLTDIGDLTASGASSITFATGINDRGDIVGQSFNDQLSGRAFIWRQKGGMADLGDIGLLGGFPASLSAFAVNSHNGVVGTAMGTGTSTQTRAFLWSNGLMLDIGILSFTGLDVFATAINSRGEIVGAGYKSPGDLRALRWILGIPLELGAMPDGRVAVQAFGVSDKGDVVGYLSPGAAASFAHAYLYQRGTFTDLGVLPGTNLSFANAVNDRSQVVGLSLNTELLNTGRAFLWDAGTLLDLGSAAATHTISEARAINKKGDVVGSSGDGVASLAWIWSDGVNTDLNTLIAADDPNRPFVTLTKANGINDKGEIAAQGTDSRLAAGNVRSYLLAPGK